MSSATTVVNKLPAALEPVHMPVGTQSSHATDDPAIIIGTDVLLRHPFTWPQPRKLRIMWTVAAATFLVSLNATSETVAGTVINEQFGISDASFPNSYWPITAWSVGAALAPPMLLAAMENFGVRYIYLASYLLFLVFLIPQAVAQNFETLIISRFFAGAFGSTVMNGVANVVGDLWETDTERSFAVTIGNFAFLGGPTLGPVFGGAILSGLHWRWIFYIQLIICGIFFFFLYCVLPETRQQIVAKQRQEYLVIESGEPSNTDRNEEEPPMKHLLYEATVRSAYLLITEPVLFIFAIWSGLAVGNVYLATQSIFQIYTINYGFSPAQVGLVQSAMFIGEVIGSLLCLWQNKIFLDSGKYNKENPGSPIIEWRLILSIPASFIGISGGLLWYAWSSSPSVNWIMPSIGLALIGVGLIIIVQSAIAYIIDAYAANAGSAIAAVSFVENMISGFLPLAAQTMYSRLGFHWASSVVGLIAFLLSFAPVVLLWKGYAIRARSKYMRQD